MSTAEYRTIQYPITCAVCEDPLIKIYEHIPFTDGHRGLDLRMVRPGALMWPYDVQRCPNCQVCASWVDTVDESVRPFVRSDDYKALANDERGSVAYRDFMCASAVAHKSGRLYEAAVYALSASWEADGKDMPAEFAAECGDEARRKLVDIWFEVCGDVFGENLPRDPEHADATLVGDAFLDNQLLVELLRRLGDWEGAERALAMARKAFEENQRVFIFYSVTPDEDELLMGNGVSMMLDLEEQLIRSRESGYVHAEVDLPLWFTE